MRTQIVILCLLVSTAHSLTCMTYNGDGNAEFTVCDEGVLCVKPKTETDPTTNAMYACNPEAGPTDIGDCGADKCETCNTDYCNVPADTQTCFEDSVDSGIHSMTNTKKICTGETKCKVILPRYDSETLVDTCGACGADENCIDCEGADCNTGYEFGECLTGDDPDGAKEFCSGTDSYTAQVAPNEKKYNPHCKRPAYTTGPTKVGEVTPGCGTCDAGDNTCVACTDATKCNAPPTNGGGAFNCFQYTWNTDAFTIGAAAACTDYYDFKGYCNGPTSAAGENDISAGGCGPCADGAANCEECKDENNACNARKCISYDGAGDYNADTTVNCNVMDSKCMRPSYGKGLTKVGSVNHGCGACENPENCHDCDGNSCNAQPAPGADFECKQYQWDADNSAFTLETDSVTCSGYYDFINNCNGPIEASEEDDVSNSGCGPCTADNCNDCTGANCNVRKCISYDVDGEDPYNADTTENCDVMGKCKRPSYTVGKKIFGSVDYGCGACGDTENCHDCDGDSCNTEPDDAGENFECKQYLWDSDTNAFTLEVASITCSGYYDFENNCNGPIEGSGQNDLSNAGCGPCTADNCNDCTGANCNERTCIKFDVDGGGTYDATNTEKCGNMGKCKRPVYTVGDTMLGSVDYGCGACGETENCHDCDDDNNCNTKPTAGADFQCKQYLWENGAYALKASVTCQRYYDFENNCNGPVEASVENDVSMEGCGPCTADNCNDCTGENCNVRTCISLDVSESAAYDATNTENCATMDSMCKRPILTYDDTVADNTIDYGCGGCSTNKNCTECDTGNNCNTKPTTTNTIKCFDWTWDTTEKKFVQSDKSEDCSIGELDPATALNCNKPKTSSVAQDDYTSNSGCGICFEADGDNCFTCKNEGKRQRGMQ